MKIIFGCMLCSIFASLSLSQEMVQVAAGTFQMGSTDSLDNGAIPLHSVTLGSFNIDEYEVTYEKWTEVYNWGLTHGYADLAAGTNGFNHSGTNNPITGVNWYDIAKWCNARSGKKRFPSGILYKQRIRHSISHRRYRSFRRCSKMECKRLSIADRSGMGVCSKRWKQQLGIFIQRQ